MSKHDFKLGDKVKVIAKSVDCSNLINVGNIGFITEVCPRTGAVRFDGKIAGWFYGNSGGELKLIKPAPTPHVHSELIKLWADGESIEFKDSYGNWRTVSGAPTWESCVEYRVKPKQVHVHSRLIKAWADGAEIQRSDGGQWFGVGTPSWKSNTAYRIKPEEENNSVVLSQIAELEKTIEDAKKQLQSLKKSV